MDAILDPEAAAVKRDLDERKHVFVNVRWEVDRTPISFGRLRWFMCYAYRRLRKYEGGSALAIPDHNGVWSQFRTQSVEGLHRLFASLAQDFARCNEHLRYTVIWPAPLWGDDTQRLAKKYATAQVTLSRRVFFSLPPGTVISGNFAVDWLLPGFELTVKSRGWRQQQWLRIRRANADRRNCVVYRSTASRNAWSGLPG